MPLIVKEEPQDFPLCPEGLFAAVLVDAVDLGEQESKFGTKHKLSLCFETQQHDEDGKPFILVKRYTWSLHEKSNLRKDLERFRGQKFTQSELSEGVDLETYIGLSCNILVVHNEVEDGKVYANIESVLPYKSAKGKIAYFELNESGTYQRVIERPDYKKPEEFALNGA
tara:strand:+ start:50803 stop:51309 length:507 start_codon:yes stop_codon:yes gene_type:complete